MDNFPDELCKLTSTYGTYVVDGTGLDGPTIAWDSVLAVLTKQARAGGPLVPKRRVAILVNHY